MRLNLLDFFILDTNKFSKSVNDQLHFLLFILLFISELFKTKTENVNGQTENKLKSYSRSVFFKLL